MAHAPKLRTNRSADKARAFAAGFATTNLQTLATGSMPQFPAQVVELHNNSAAAETANLVLEDGSSMDVVVGPNETRKVTIPVQQLVGTSGDNISAIAYWWDTPQLDEMQKTFPRGAA